MKLYTIKKVIVSFLLVLMLLGTSQVFASSPETTISSQATASSQEQATNTPQNNTATSEPNKEIINQELAGQLIKVKESTKKEMQDYIDLYGSDAYGMTAYILNKVRLYSIPLCFIGIVVGAIFQYVIGIRKLDLRDRGLKLIVTFVTILVICQVVPLIFAIVVRGWRG